MKHLVLFWFALSAVFSAPFSHAAEKEKHPVRDGLIKVGTGILKNEGRKLVDKRDKTGEKDAPKAESSNPRNDENAETKRTWADRGKDMLDVVLHKDGTAAEVIKATMDVVLDEYREQFKDEGRRYAREMGDTLAERATANRKIASTLSSVRVLCWCVVVYLTLVTIYLVFTVRRLRRANAQLLELVEASLRKKSAEDGK